LYSNQLHDYLNSHKLIYDFQSGFRKGHSTDSALIHLMDSIRLNMDNGLYTGVVLIDLQKAFDTVDHTILSHKLSALGANSSALNWFKSYLYDRKQYVEINGEKSALGDITCGVPQGSILGPLLFTVYVNDMIDSVNCDLFLYADDSALVVSHKDPAVIQETLRLELEGLSTWLEENKLSLHLGKTESILFASNPKLSKCKSLKINCNGVDITSTNTVKYLGVQIDQNMSGTSMGNSVVKRINSRIKFLYRKQIYLNRKIRIMLSSALVLPIFDYACTSWYNGQCKKIKTKLQTAQNKLVRFILGFHSRQSVGCNELKSLKWLDVSRRVQYLSLSIMFNIHHKTAPAYLCNIVPVSHSHNTRRSNSCYVIPMAKSQGCKTFIICAIKLWNSLPNVIKMLESKSIFKTKCKCHLMNQMCEDKTGART